jgi:DNA mismatch endonuclease (patch repair protein)
LTSRKSTSGRKCLVTLGATAVSPSSLDGPDKLKYRGAGLAGLVESRADPQSAIRHSKRPVEPSLACLGNPRLPASIVTDPARSAIMRAVRGKDTGPELVVRRVLHRAGFRFRLHRRDLPGSPDVVLPKWNAAIFVHGCFWHRHPRCRRSTTPVRNRDDWQAKFAANRRRDRRNVRDLERAGWRVIVVWECETRDERTLLAFLRRELRAKRKKSARPG